MSTCRKWIDMLELFKKSFWTLLLCHQDTRPRFLGTPVPILLQPGLPPLLHPPRLTLKTPPLIHMPRRQIRILKLLSLKHTLQAILILLSCVLFRIVIPHPPSNLEKSDRCVRLVRFDGADVDVVEFFTVDEARALEDAYSFESLE